MRSALGRKLCLLGLTGLFSASVGLADTSEAVPEKPLETGGQRMLVLPASDVISADVPYLLTIRIPDAVTGNKVDVAVSLKGPHGGVLEIAGQFDVPKEKRPLVLRLDARSLAAGTYRGEVKVGAGNIAESYTLALYRMPTRLEKPFPYGIYVVPFPKEADEIDAQLALVEEVGFNFISNHGYAMNAHDSLIWDRAARTGIRMRPSLRYWKVGEHGVVPEGENQVLSDGTVLERNRCFRNEAYKQYAAENLENYLRSYTGHPAFDDAIYFGDDLFIGAKSAQGKVSIGCYCDLCKAAFKKATRKEAPLGPKAPRAVMSDKDPWLLWVKDRCENNYGVFVEAMEEAKNRVSPAIEMGLAHGAPDNPFIGLECGIYGPLTQRTGVVSSYNYPFLRSPAADLIAHYEIGKMGNRDKDVWQLGIIAADRTPVHGGHVQQNYWNMLAAGYKAISYFSWWDIHKVDLKVDKANRWRLDAVLKAMKRCGAHKEWVLPVAKSWKREAAEAAALYSVTTDSMNLVPFFKGNKHSKEVTGLFRMALAANLPMEIVSEEEVKAGILKRFKAICLHDVQHMTGRVSVELLKFIAEGGKVYMDPDYLYGDFWKPRIKAPIKGSLEVAPETMVQMLVDQLARPITVDNRDVSMRRFVSGDAEYAVLVNNYSDRYWGMPYAYGDPAANFAKSDLIREKAVEATVRFAAKGKTVYDLSSGERVGSTDDALTMTLEPSWGRVLIALPAKTATLTLTTSKTVSQGEALRMKMTVADGTGKTIASSFAAKVSLVSPSGLCHGAGGFVNLKDGVGSYVWSVGINEEPGRWTLSVEGGFPRKRLEAAVEVKKAKQEIQVLTLGVVQK